MNKIKNDERMGASASAHKKQHSFALPRTMRMDRKTTRNKHDYHRIRWTSGKTQQRFNIICVCVYMHIICRT